MAHITHTLRRAAIRNRHGAPAGAVDQQGRRRRGFKRVIATGTSKFAVVAADERRAVWAAYVACAAALAYVLPHLWWLLGISWTYPGDFAEIQHQSTMLVIGDLAIVTLVVVWALLPLALVQPWGRIVPRRLLLAAAWVASVALVLWSLSYFNLRVMLATGRVESGPEYAAGDAHPAAVWGYFWYSLFLVWGLALGATASWSRRTRP